MRKLIVLLFSGIVCVSALADSDRGDRRGHRHDHRSHHGDSLAAAKSEATSAKSEAREVCQDLRGGTPGLFRLCVAFCKVRDLDKLGRVLDPQRLERRVQRSERMLARYNERKLPADPDMPCIETASVCPCWGPEVESASNWTGRSIDPACMASDADAMSFSLLQSGGTVENDRAMIIATRTQQAAGTVYECASTDSMLATSLSMAVTEVDFNVCRTKVTSTCGALGQ